MVVEIDEFATFAAMAAENKPAEYSVAGRDLARRPVAIAPEV
jgi:hypothetical protein